MTYTGYLTLPKGGFPKYQILARHLEGRSLAPEKRLDSGPPTVNWVGGEMALVMDALQMQDILAHHLSGKFNTEAGFLSRPDMRGSMRVRLADISVRR